MIDLIDKKHFISFLDFVVVDHYVYFSNDTFNALVQLDMDTNEIVHMEPFIDVPLNEAHLHTGCIQFNNQIFFYSIDTAQINVYDLNSRKQSSLIMKNLRGGFYTADICGENLYFFPTDLSKGLISYTVSKKCLQNVIWYQKEISGFFRYSNLSLNIWIAYEVNNNRFLILDLHKQNVKEFYTKNIISRLDYCDGKVWFVSHDKGDLYQCQENTDEEIEYKYINHDFVSAINWQYLDVCALANKIFLISGDLRRIFVVNENKKQRNEYVDLPDETIDRFVTAGNEVRKKIINNKLFYFFQQRNTIVQIDLTTMSVELISLNYLINEEVLNYMSLCNYNSRVIMQDNCLTLGRFIDLCIENK